MIPSEFEYHRAGSVKEALTLLAERDGAKVLAGGHSLLPAMKLRMSTPELLIDIGGLDELYGVNSSGGGIRIGANTTHHEIEVSPPIRQGASALAEAAAVIGDVQVRNRGTIGGSIAHADPAADYPAALLALDAVVEVTGPGGSRDIDATDFFIDLFLTALGPDEIVTAVTVPSAGSGTTSCYRKFPHPASRFAVCGCAARLTRDGTNCSEARVAFNGLANAAFRDDAVEQAIAGQPLSDATIESAAALAAEGRELMDDAFAGETYRRHLAKVFARAALQQAAKG
jgi:carbon-monoxide dehydrogenase medium subunit